MGIIGGALGGLGGAMENVGSTMFKNELDRETKSQDRVQESDLALQRAKALEEFKMGAADRERTSQTTRIDAQAGKIADEKVAGKTAAVSAGIVDRASWSPEQQAAVDQSLGNDRQAILSDPNTRTKAAIQTGDISPTEAMKTANSMEISQMKLDNLLARADDKNATAKEIADIRAESVTAAAQLRVDAANQRAANGKVDGATRRMLITSLDTDIRASTSQLNMLGRQLTDTPPMKNGKPNPAYVDMQNQITELRGDIASSKKQKEAFFAEAGITKEPEAGATTPKPTSPASAPKPGAGKPAAAASSARPPLTNFLKP